jgi:hypothetical protein
MLRECFVYCSMCLGVSFIAPRQLGAVGDQLGRQILPSVEWCTGHSVAPPDMNSTCPVLDFLPYWAQLTIGPSGRWRIGHCSVHTRQSGVTNRPLAWPRVAR